MQDCGRDRAESYPSPCLWGGGNSFLPIQVLDLLRGAARLSELWAWGEEETLFRRLNHHCRVTLETD